jgi:Type I phosphodiesterase / nucleotide pyrophosphatase
MNSANTQQVGVPAIFGMNFQAVSVGQKLVDPMLSCVRSDNAPGCDPSYVPGGYEPGTLAFTPQLAGAVKYVDGAIGSMVQGLAQQSVLDSTKIIISAKHGQSPIDPSKLALIGHAETKVFTNAGITPAQVTDDDVALIWLANQSQTKAAVQALQADKARAKVWECRCRLLSGDLSPSRQLPTVAAAETGPDAVQGRCHARAGPERRGIPAGPQAGVADGQHRAGVGP